jgi:hypothetical protein
MASAIEDILNSWITCHVLGARPYFASLTFVRIMWRVRSGVKAKQPALGRPIVGKVGTDEVGQGEVRRLAPVENRLRYVGQA